MDEEPPLTPADDAGHVYRCWFPVGSPENAEAWERNAAAGVTAAGMPVESLVSEPVRAGAGS